jgi:hypothetical protein
MDKRARLLALNAFEQKQASRLNSSLKTRNAAMGQPDPELIAVAFGANDVARTPEQERAELEARLARFFKPHISTQIMRHRWLTAANIRDLLEVWYPVVEPHLRNLTGRRAEVRIEDNHRDLSRGRGASAQDARRSGCVQRLANLHRERQPRHQQ